MRKEIIVILLIVTMLLIGTRAEASNYIERHFYELKAGQEVTIEFDYKIDPDNISLDGFEYIGFENGVYTFKAERDMDKATIRLEYSKEQGSEDIDLEGGEGGSSNDIGEGEAVGDIEWGSFELGKHSWGDIDKSYAIRIDMMKYQEYDFIYLEDKSTGLEMVGDVIISKLEPREDNTVENTGVVEYEVIEQEEDRFVLKVPVEKARNNKHLRYDVVYNMRKTDNEYSNRYRIYTTVEWEIEKGKGEGTGNQQETPPIEDEEEPVIEDEEPVIEDNKPIIEDEEPVVEDNEPIIEDEEPVVEDNEPIIEDDEPVVEDNEPIIEDDEPVIEDNEPIIEDDEEPVIEDSKEPEVTEENNEPKTEEKEPIRLPSLGERNIYLYLSIGILFIFMGLYVLCK